MALDLPARPVSPKSASHRRAAGLTALTCQEISEGSWALRTGQGRQPASLGGKRGTSNQHSDCDNLRIAIPPPPMGTAVTGYEEMLALCLQSATSDGESSCFGSLSYQSAISKVHQYVEACDILISEWKSTLDRLSFNVETSSGGSDCSISTKRWNPARDERGSFAVDRYLGGSLVRLPYDNQAVTYGALIAGSLPTLGYDTNCLEATCHSMMHAVCDHFPWEVITREYWYRDNWQLLKRYTKLSEFAALCSLYAAAHARSTHGKQKLLRKTAQRIGQSNMRVTPSLWGNLDFSNAVKAFCVDTGETAGHRFLDTNTEMASTLAVRIINDACDVRTDMATLEPCNTLLMLKARNMLDRADCFIRNYATWETDQPLLAGSAALSLSYSIGLNRGSVHEKLLRRYASGNFTRRPRPCAACALETAHAPFLTEWQELPPVCTHRTSPAAGPGVFGAALDRYRANDPAALSFLQPESTAGGLLTRYILDISMRQPAEVSLLVSPFLSLLLIESDLLYRVAVDTIPEEYIGPLVRDDQ